MTKEQEKGSSRPHFDPYPDRRGQGDGSEVSPAEYQRIIQEDPSWQAQEVRLSSDQPRLDSTSGGSIDSVNATEAETPPENLRRIQGEPEPGKQD